MNVTELARRLRVNTKTLLEVLPEYGFDIGKRAIKVDDKVAAKIMRRWKYIKKELDEKARKEAEEKKQKEREMRLESGETVAIPDLLTVREFAERLNLSITEVITELMKNGILANQNQNIDYDTASIMAGEFGFHVKKEDDDIGVEDIKEEEKERAQVLQQVHAKAQHLEQRPPVVVVMGHVDHGKTKLLDTIRKSDVVAGEAGGITQHIGAYQTVWQDPKTKEERPITFIDTPGHEAFTVMRSRGATVADVGILIVAADDGVKPQTEEVIQILKAAKMPFVVAINKIDKEAADPQRVKSELSEKGVLTDEWGGTVPMVEISALNNLHIDKLLDVILLTADLNEDTIKADPTLPAVGTIIESHKDKNIGSVATVLVQAGTLKKGDPLVVNGEIYGKVRAMRNDRGEELEVAGPSVPAQIIGFKVAPEVGDILNVGAAEDAEMIDVRAKTAKQTGATRQTVSSALDVQEEGEEKKKTLNLVVKADVLGSLEAIIGSLQRIRHDEVGVKIVGKGLGNITENDVATAEATKGVLIGFNVKPTPSATDSINEKNLQFKEYNVIYHLIEWVKEELEKLLDTEKIITEVGNLKVLGIFRTDKKAMTIGGRVESGKVVKGAKVRVKRDGEIIGEGIIATVQRGQSEAKEAPAGTECGLRFEGKTKIEIDDVLEFYTEESKARKIEFAQ